MPMSPQRTRKTKQFDSPAQSYSAADLVGRHAPHSRRTLAAPWLTPMSRVLCDRLQAVDIDVCVLLPRFDCFSTVCTGCCVADLLEHGIEMPEVLVPTSRSCLFHGRALFKQAASSSCSGLTQGCFKGEAPAFSQRPGDAVRVAVEMRTHIGKRCLVAVLLDVALDGGEVESAVVAPSCACHMRPLIASAPHP